MLQTLSNTNPSCQDEPFQSIILVLFDQSCPFFTFIHILFLHSLFSLQSTDTGSTSVLLLQQEEKISHLSCEQSHCQLGPICLTSLCMDSFELWMVGNILS